MTQQADAQSVTAHYTHEAANLGPAILAALRAAAPHRDAVTLDDLAPIDQFHAGGKRMRLATFLRYCSPVQFVLSLLDDQNAQYSALTMLIS